MKNLLFAASVMLAFSFCAPAQIFGGNTPAKKVVNSTCTDGQVATYLNGKQSGCADNAGGSTITGCGFGQTLNGAVCDTNTGVIPSLPIIQSNAATYCAGSGTAGAQTCGLTPALTAYTNGMVVSYNPGTTNTTTQTLNIDSLGAKSILTATAGALSAGDLTAGQRYLLAYDGTQFRLPASGSSTAPNFSQTFYTGVCSSGAVFTRLTALDGSAGSTCYGAFAPVGAAMNMSGANPNVTWAVPVQTAVASLKVTPLVYASATNNGTIQVQTACIASGTAVGSPSYSTGANTITANSTVPDAMIANSATNAVTCAAGSLLMVRLNWSAVAGTQYLTGVNIQW